MTMAELETAVREKARVDRRSSSTTSATGRSGCGRTQRGTGVGVATELGPIDFAAVARACGARGVRVERDAEFEPAFRQALADDRPTVIQVALDKAWLSIDQLHPGLDSADIPPRPGRGLGRRGSGRAVRAPWLATRGVHPLHGRGRRPRRDLRPPLRDGSAAVRGADRRPRRARRPVAGRRAGPAYPHIYGRDRPSAPRSSARSIAVMRAPDDRFAGLGPA